MGRRPKKTSYWQDAPVPREQLVLFSSTLEEIIPEDHPVRLVDEILDQMLWTTWEAAYNGSRGQPPIHPSIMAKILLFAMIRRVRSSRQIEYQLKHSIDFMWLASGRKIDHTTLSEFRRKHTKELSELFKQMVKVAIDLNIANLSELCIDGTRVLANASRHRTWTAKRLADALEVLDAQIADALADLDVNDTNDEDLLGNDTSADRLPKEVADLKERRKQLEGLAETCQEMDEIRKRNGTRGPAQLPKTDLDSRILPNKEGGYAANYTPMAVVETQSGFVVDCEVVIGNVEHAQLGTTIENVGANFDVTIRRAMGDKAYTTGENLSLAEEKQIELVGPLAERTCSDNPALREDLSEPVAEADLDRLPINPQTKRFDKSAFVYDQAADCYFCPAGKPLPRRTAENKTQRDGTKSLRLVYTCNDCVGCPLSERCRKNTDSKRGREVADDQHEGARRRQRERMKRPEMVEAYASRQHLGEVPFAVIKTMFDMRRFLLRGIEGVGQEWRWAATAFNLKKLMTCWKSLRSEVAALVVKAVA